MLRLQPTSAVSGTLGPRGRLVPALKAHDAAAILRICAPCKSVPASVMLVATCVSCLTGDSEGDECKAISYLTQGAAVARSQ